MCQNIINEKDPNFRFRKGLSYNFIETDEFKTSENIKGLN